MKIVLYAAVSADGFICTKDGDSDWVLDDELFDKTVKDFGCVVVGHNTFNQYLGDIYPIESVQHLVLNHKHAGLDVKYPNVTYVTSAEQAVKKAQELGFDKLLVIGGSQTNGSFAAAELLNEVWLDEHPLKLGEGKKLLGDFTGDLNLKLISSEPQSQGFVHSKYSV